MKTRIVPSFLNRMKPCECFEGETIEEKVNRIVNNNEPITDGAPIILRKRKTVYYPNTIQEQTGGT